MSPLDRQVRDALAVMHSMLEADGYELEVIGASSEAVALKIVALPGACAECLVPPSIMEIYARDGLKAVPDCAEAAITFVYPDGSAGPPV